MILVVFNYTLSDFTTNAQILSQYRTQTTFNNGGDAITDNVKLTSDDETLIKKFLKGACLKIADVLSGYTRYITDTDGVMEIPPFEYDVTFNALPGQVVFRINMPDTFITSSIEGMEDAIKNAIENYILSRTSEVRGMDNRSYEDMYEKSLSSVRSYLSRRYSAIRRNYNAF